MILSRIIDYDLLGHSKRSTLWLATIFLAGIALLSLAIYASFNAHRAAMLNDLKHSAETIEKSTTRTLESITSTLNALALEIGRDVAEKDRLRITQRLNQATRFTPHIRQLVLLSGDTVIADSTGRAVGQPIDLEKLSLDAPFSIHNPDMFLGKTLNYRFLPTKGIPATQPHPTRTIIPIAFTYRRYQGERLTLLVALNPDYLKALLIESNHNAHMPSAITRIDGTPLVYSQVPQHFQPLLERLKKNGVQERLVESRTESGMVYNNVKLSPHYAVAIVHEFHAKDHWLLWKQKNEHLFPVIYALIALILGASGLFVHDTKKRRTAESERKLSYSALAQLPVMVVIFDAKHRITYVNNAFERQMLYLSHELIGKPISTLNTSNVDTPRFGDIAEGLAPNSDWLGEFVTKRADGMDIHLRSRISPVSSQSGKVTHYVGIFSDITQQKEADKELRIAATAFNVQTGMIVTNDLGYVLRVNPALLTMFEQTEDALIDQPASILFSEHTSSSYNFEDITQALKSRGHWEGEISVRKNNGDLLAVLINCNPVLNEFGDAANYVISVTDITARIEAEERVTHLAYYDALTSLPNRRLFNDRMPHAIKTSSRTGQYGALLLIDLDYFKTINDTKGHDVGDGLLVEAALRLKNSLRDTDTVIRMGGDEFVVLLEHIGNTHHGAAIQTELVASKINQAIAEPYTIQSHTFTISASIGIALFRGPDYSSADLLKHADVALYEAKRAGRNTKRFFSREMLEGITSSVEMAQRLRTATEENRLEINVQPIVNAHGRVTGGEALVRWKDHDGEYVPPSDFLPVAERTDLILSIGRWVLEESIALLGQLTLNGVDPGFRLSVNVSPQHFLNDQFVSELSQLLSQNRRLGQHLTLEVSENIMQASLKKANTHIEAINRLGVNIELDDFGTGSSALYDLSKLPISGLKMDASFVHALDTDDEQLQSLCFTILTIAKSLHLRVSAKGIENQHQLNLLEAQGCDAFQGYYWCPPIDQVGFIRLIARADALVGHNTDIEENS